MSKGILFSIIMPVYNKENYIRRSIESVTHQSYTNWELVIVDDGSTDSSYALCDDYRIKDNTRISLYSKENGGAGEARNYALNFIHGEYVLFLDSDDYIELDTLRILYETIINNDKPDIVSFFMREWIDGQSYINSRSLVYSDNIDEIRDFLMFTDISIGTRACKRSVIENNKIRFPSNRVIEDIEVTLLEYAYAKSIIQVPYALYNYDKNVPMNSRRSGYDGYPLLLTLPERLRDIFENRNIYEKFELSLAKCVLTFFRNELSLQKNNQKRMELKNLCCKKLKGVYPIIQKKFENKYIVFGGYTLRREVQSTMLDASDIVHFQFSSIVSAMDYSKLSLSVNNVNEYRKNMLNREFSRDFLQHSVEYNADFVIVDLMEERYDIGIYDNRFVTLSDAFLENKDINVNEVISRLSKKCTELFDSASTIFADFLLENYDLSHIIVVENYLMEYTGSLSAREKHDGNSKIRRMNKLLRSYYECLEMKLKGAIVINPKDNIDSFTSIDYIHGCYPYHSNAAWEYKIGNMLFDYL